MSTVQTIDDVVARLDAIVEESVRASSRLAYFATLYREMTCATKACIQLGVFEDGARMEALDIAFANRYFEAYDAYKVGRPTTNAWTIAFQTAESPRPMILQHILLGINAHINLDLGVSAGLLCPDVAVLHLRRDFDQINGVIERLIDLVQGDLDQVSPLLRAVDRLGGRHDERLAAFTIQLARAGAWDLATRLAPLPPTEHEPLVIERDRLVHQLGERIRWPGFFLGSISRVGSFLESKDIARVVRLMTGVGERSVALLTPKTSTNEAIA